MILFVSYYPVYNVDSTNEHKSLISIKTFHISLFTRSVFSCTTAAFLFVIGVT